MIKSIVFHAKRMAIKAKMARTKAAIEDAEMRIAHDKALIDALWRDRADLQAEAFWLEKNNFPAPKRMAA